MEAPVGALRPPPEMAVVRRGIFTRPVQTVSSLVSTGRNGFRKFPFSSQCPFSNSKKGNRMSPVSIELFFLAILPHFRSKSSKWVQKMSIFKFMSIFELKEGESNELGVK